jgi:3-hydroxyacyl-CoA dehydrogenase/enoyl-CoA hydratase/3-hydroxybutyryl-CoA epimerase
VDSIGVKEIVRRLEALEKAHGARFRPAPLLIEHANVGRPFYGTPAA